MAGVNKLGRLSKAYGCFTSFLESLAHPDQGEGPPEVDGEAAEALGGAAVDLADEALVPGPLHHRRKAQGCQVVVRQGVVDQLVDALGADALQLGAHLHQMFL